jgi:hypothetical protein
MPIEKGAKNKDSKTFGSSMIFKKFRERSSSRKLLEKYMSS